MDGDGGDDADDHGEPDRVEAGLRNGRRQVEAAHIDEASPGQGVALPRPRQALQHGEVPKKELQQQRHVADDLDVDGREPRHEPVGGKARNADDEPDHGRQHDAEARHQQRVEQPDQESPAVGHGVVVVDQVLGDVEAGRAVDEAETGGDVLLPEVGCRIGDQDREQRHQRDDQHDLIKGLAHLGPIEVARQ